MCPDETISARRTGGRGDAWAEAEAMPSDEAVSRVRRLIGRIKSALGDLDSVSRASLQADLAHARDHTARQSARIRQLENKPAELLGEQVWKDSGLGAVEDIDALRRSVTMLEQRVVDLTEQLDRRQQELDAARATNRDLMTRLNRAPRPEMTKA
jgi:chromosome segregation ATPase